MDSVFKGCSSVGMAALHSFIEMLSNRRSAASTFIARKDTQSVLSYLILCVGCFTTYWGIDVYQNRRMVSHSLPALNAADDYENNADDNENATNDNEIIANDNENTADGNEQTSHSERRSRRFRRWLLKMRQSSIGGSAAACGITLMGISGFMNYRLASNLPDYSSTNTAIGHCLTPTFAQCYQTIAAHSHGMLVDLWKIVCKEVQEATMKPNEKTCVGLK